MTQLLLKLVDQLISCESWKIKVVFVMGKSCPTCRPPRPKPKSPTTKGKVLLHNELCGSKKKMTNV